MNEHIETFSRKSLLKRRQYYFRMVASENGHTLMQSEGYFNELDRNKTAWRVAKVRALPMLVQSL